ncbi:transferase [Lithospermum erythrorhizon]|uniref:Transferase n=1 Tax=Lithospermum erythrorhizon TaxID=34254 RepID=A0AAV3P3Y0_LITER
MAQVLGLRPLPGTRSFIRCRSSQNRVIKSTQSHLVNTSWAQVQQSVQSHGRFFCLFSDGSKQERARKALEGALGGKKTEFEKWDREIKKREEAGGGGGSGGGGWFGWGRWFGGFDGDQFWQETQQAILTILGIITIYLIVAKGDVMVAVIFNPLLFALRGTRNGLTYLSSKIMNVVNPSISRPSTIAQDQVAAPISAKETVVRKWGGN